MATTDGFPGDGMMGRRQCKWRQVALGFAASSFSAGGLGLFVIGSGSLVLVLGLGILG
ncbi:hypothetical protein F383_17245 [Gossypium arboreum]|uniref:Uncharacterized protein n=1 Tax=Gossypium arboreum TaxID=29729 RepID=A0A0B0NPB8_GOSAR|nr:hypothetical protein F383_17245 [Gossypium arboreum]